MSANLMPLAKYRLEHLGMKQSEVAEKAGCQQAWISQIERGHLPKPWEREALLKAYNLKNRESYFVKLVMDARKLLAMKKPISETEPLFASATNVTGRQVSEAGNILKAASADPKLSRVVDAIGIELCAMKARKA